MGFRGIVGAGGGAVLAGVVLLLCGPRGERAPGEPVPERGAAAAATESNAPVSVAAGAAHRAGGASLARAPHPSAVAERRVELEDVPESELRTGLLALSAAARSNALERLARIHFNPRDVDSLRVEHTGDLYFVCTFGLPDDAAAAAALEAVGEEAPEVAGAAVSVDSPPIYHSKPDAARVLFLDFNGQVVEDTLWNSSATYGPTESWDCLAWSSDSDRTTFSATEQEYIRRIWARVAEDYAPFDVDVTTEQPASWNRYVGHALFTPTTDANGVQCPHYGYGGIAYLDVFGDRSYSYDRYNARSPAWIKETYYLHMAEAASHELGHNLGLSHDGTTSSEYYSGHDNGGVEWAPIMGVSYYDDVSQWSKGEYYDYENEESPEDDLAIIAGKLGYRSDDHGDTSSSATALTPGAEGDFAGSGIIEITDDPDVFSFSTFAGEISVTARAYEDEAASYTRGANLDIELRLYDSAGGLVAQSNPELELDASITATVAAGEYFLHVVPTGMGDPTASQPTGYTSYGSLGQYWLSGLLQADADGDGIPNQWEATYFGGYTAGDPDLDSDGDGADNLAEYVAGTLPDDAASVFKVTTFKQTDEGGAYVINWSTLSGRSYSVKAGESLESAAFAVLPGADALPHTVNSYTDTTERAASEVFYRVDVTLEL